MLVVVIIAGRLIANERFIICSIGVASLVPGGWIDFGLKAIVKKKIRVALLEARVGGARVKSDDDANIADDNEVVGLMLEVLIEI